MPAPVRFVFRLLVLAFACLMLAILVFLEILVLYPVAGWVYALPALLFAGALVRRTSLRRQKLRLAALTLAWTLLAALHLVPWSSRKPFLRDLRRVQPGMTEAEARRIMGRYIQGTGWPARPGAPDGQELTLRDSVVFRHSNDGRFNSDWGIVSFTNDRVAAVDFSAD